MNDALLKQVVTGHAPALQRFNVEQLHGMLRLGILQEGVPVELIDGLLVSKDRSDAGGDPMIHGPRHALAVKRWQRLARQLDEFPCHLISQLPVTLASDLEPEPDGAIIRGTEDDYRDRHPGPHDILVVCEIADSSLEYDRTTKQAVYASAGIPVYWIVNLPGGCVEVFQGPTQNHYDSHRIFSAHDELAIAFASGRALSVPVASLLP